MNKEQQQAVFNLYTWYNSDSDNFTSRLYSLICKADLSNKAKLRRAFPVEVALLEEWQNSETSEGFFKKYQIQPTRNPGLTLVGSNVAEFVKDEIEGQEPA